MAIVKIHRRPTLAQRAVVAVKLATAFAIAAEIGMALYTESFPDTYKDYTVTSCTTKQDDAVELTAIGQGEHELSWRKRTFNATIYQAEGAGLSCPMISGKHRPRICDIETTGQYIPLISAWPDIKSINCKLATYEERTELENAIEHGYVSDNMIWSMMKNDRQP